MADRPLAKRLWYSFLQGVLRLAGIALLGVRCRGRHRVPSQGGGLVCPNHQSLYDPMLVGLAVDRHLNYLARDTLFVFAPFRWLIRSLDAIPIDREGLGLSGLRETLRRLKRGELVLIFPEGSRTPDGNIQPLRPGFVALARRGRVPLIPVGIDGAYDAWPRWRKWPGLAVVHVVIGEPITPTEITDMGDDELVEQLHRRIRACSERARQGRQR